MVGKEIDVDRNAQQDQAKSRGVMVEVKIEQAPGTAEIAADAGVHEASEQGYAADPEEIRLRVNPGADLCLEDFHDRADEVIDQDDLCLVKRLEPRGEQHGLDGYHAEKQEIVTRQ